MIIAAVVTLLSCWFIAAALLALALGRAIHISEVREADLVFLRAVEFGRADLLDQRTTRLTD